MKYLLATLSIAGSVLAVPYSSYSVPTSLSTFSTSYAVTSTPMTTPAWSTTSVASSTPVVPTPTCDVESDGDNGNHYGWCKKAQHSGTYKNGKSGDSDSDGPGNN
jgi:hypothetical protein